MKKFSIIRNDCTVYLVPKGAEGITQAYLKKEG
jgi:hypothetical protein